MFSLTNSVLSKALIGIIIALSLLLGFAKLQLNKVEKQVVALQETNAVLKANNTTLKANVDAALDANKSTIDANKKLLQERKDAIALIAELARTKQRAVSNLQAANKKIDEMMKDPKNNGAVAPVLRETLRDIQNRNKQ